MLRRIRRILLHILSVFSAHKFTISLLVTLLLVMGSAYTICKLEPDTFTNFFDGVYWTMTTIATVGYGDYTPLTPEGKFFTIFLTIFGIVIHGLIISQIIEYFSAYKLKKKRGELMYTKKNHYIVIYLSKKSKRFIVQLINEDPNVNIVLIDTYEEAPFEHPNVHYIKGFASRLEVLENANIKYCKSVMIFSPQGYGNDHEAADGKTLLIASMVEANYPGVQTVVEIQDVKNKPSFVHAKIDRIIASEDLATTIGLLSVTRPEMMGKIEDILNKRD